MENYRVLLVDDSSAIRETVSEILIDAGYPTDTAASGREAVEMVSKHDYDLILLDLMMPGMDGGQTLMQLRKIGCKAKIVIVTAFATIEAAVELIKKGADDFISKPFDLETLIRIIEKVMRDDISIKNLQRLNLNDVLNSLSNPIRRRIIEILEKTAKMRFMDIVRGLNKIDHTRVVFHLKTLREAGIVEQDMDKTYFLTPEGRNVLKSMHMFNCT